jgi:predicted transcriptional regulator
LGEGNVKAVQQIVAESRPLAYTTIMTVLDRLVRKGMLARRKVGRSFAYAPQATRDAARRAAVRELLDGYFDGSEEALIGFLERRPAAPSRAPAQMTDQIDTVLL